MYHRLSSHYIRPGPRWNHSCCSTQQILGSYTRYGSSSRAGWPWFPPGLSFAVVPCRRRVRDWGLWGGGGYWEIKVEVGVFWRQNFLEYGTIFSNISNIEQYGTILEIRTIWNAFELNFWFQKTYYSYQAVLTYFPWHNKSDKTCPGHYNDRIHKSRTILQGLSTLQVLFEPNLKLNIGCLEPQRISYPPPPQSHSPETLLLLPTELILGFFFFCFIISLSQKDTSPHPLQQSSTFRLWLLYNENVVEYLPPTISVAKTVGVWVTVLLGRGCWMWNILCLWCCFGLALFGVVFC